MNTEDYGTFTEKFLAKIPYLGDEAEQYANDGLIRLIQTADTGVHRLFFSSVSPVGSKVGKISVHKLSVLCVSNILSVCNNPSIAGRFKKSCAQQINSWFE